MSIGQIFALGEPRISNLAVFAIAAGAQGQIVMLAQAFFELEVEVIDLEGLIVAHAIGLGHVRVEERAHACDWAAEIKVGFQIAIRACCPSRLAFKRFG